MTETFSNHQVPQSPDSQTPSSRPTTKGSTTSKLRDSCHACAQSKVKCHKQKPTCSRCAGRGLTCEYFHSKRPGRKRESRHSISTESNSESINVDRPVSSGSQDHWANTAANGGVSVAQEYINQLLTPAESLKPDNMSAADCSISTSSNSSSTSGFFFGDLINMPDSGLSSTDTGLNTSFEDFFASPIDFLDLEPLKQRPVQPHNGIDITRLLIPDDTIQPPLLEISPTSHNNVFHLSDSQMLSTQLDLSEPPDSASCCLMPALDLMKRLSVSSSPPNGLSPTQGTNTPCPPVQVVVEDNKQAIEAVTAMVKCACAEDGYLLTILSMLVLKILARFATAVHKQSIDRVTIVHDGDCAGRIAAQLVLGELHRVQRLINLLTPRLQSYKTRVEIRWAVPGQDAARRDSHVSAFERGEMKTAPFSATIVDQVEMDLRKAVSALSAKIIHMLRQS